MNEICERERLYGLVQYRFRKQRSTADCVFIILFYQLLKQPKESIRQYQLHFAILPKPMIQFADLLYTKLRNIDFEGRVVSTIRSMNFNDSVCISLDSGVSEPFYFTQGVKQGLSL